MLKRFSVATSKGLLRQLKDPGCRSLRLACAYGRALMVPAGIAVQAVNSEISLPSGVSMGTAFFGKRHFQQWLDSMLGNSARMSAFITQIPTGVSVMMNFYGQDKTHLGELVVAVDGDGAVIQSATLADPV